MSKPVLFVSHRKQRCGVREFGVEISTQLQASTRFRFKYVECESLAELADEVSTHDPAALIFNYHPTTMPWGNAAAIVFGALPTIAIVHDVTSEMADAWDDPFFFRLITHDPDLKTSNRKFFRAPRPLPRYIPTSVPPSDGPVRIGSFGFAAPDKGFRQLVEMAQSSFESCVIRLHIPFSDFGDLSGERARALVQDCRSAIKKPGVSIEALHDFLPKEQLLESLATNHINVLLYDPDRGGGGISSASDIALAAGRPIALRRGKMFRNFASASPSIFVDDSTLPEILGRGTGPLQPFVRSWSQEALVTSYEAALTAAIESASTELPPYRAVGSMLQRLLSVSEDRASEFEERMIAMHGATVQLRHQLELMQIELARKKARPSKSERRAKLSKIPWLKRLKFKLQKRLDSA